MTQRAVSVVPHTHWDREWYSPFQTFRLRLVRLLDDLLPLLERDPSYARFLLDGQVAVIDDYLEVRPEAADRIRALAASGRVSIGPWYILMDEFLVSGETIVRNLQTGIARGAVFGGVMPVGYLPDMFGHIAQMPQILRQAGFEHAVVWRGVPSQVDRTAFWWESPDGSAVRAEYLVSGYGNGAGLPDDAGAVAKRVADHADEVADFLLPGGALLFMNGTDHQAPQPWLGKVVAGANALQDGFRLTVTSLADHLAAAPVDGLPRWRGELRSGARSNVLMGVASNRVDVKQAAARTERSLERRAEPASALFLPAERWPGSLLDLAWREVIRNSAHDSICACSVDEVVDAVHHRFAEARQIADGLGDQALEALGRSLADPGPCVVNLAHRPRSGMVEVVTGAEQPPSPHVQVLSESRGMPGSLTLDGPTVKSMLGMLQGSRLADDAYVTAVSLTEDGDGIHVHLGIGTEPRDDVPVEEAKRDLYTRLSARPDQQVHLQVDQPPHRRVLALAGDVPGFGWQAFAESPLGHPVRAEESPDGRVMLTNGLTTARVDPTSGTWSLDGTGGFGRLVDGGDHGDTYNYSPPAGDTLVDRPGTVTVSIGDRGPVRATVSIAATYEWPDHVDGRLHRRTGSREVVVTTTLELRADERLLRVTTAFVNPCRDHRLRVHLPLPTPAAISRAECAFAVVERGLTAEGRDEERGLPTFPSRRFVSAGGLTVVHEGLLEYELVDIGPQGPEGGPEAARELALTLLRATGRLSGLGMAYRPLPAGPLTPMEGPQMLGPVEVRYALCLGDTDPYALADDAFLPLEVVGSFGGGTRPPTGSALRISGAEVSSVVRRAGCLEVRVFNPSAEATTLTVGDRTGWTVDLRGRPIAPFDGNVGLGPFAIATLRLVG